MIRTALLVALAAVIGLNVYTLNAARLAGDQVPMTLGFGASVVLSGSMEPELSVGDLLIVVPADSYGVGDVVVYQAGRIAVVHRIIAIDGDTITTQGDANNTPDDPISLSVVKGRVLVAIPIIGHLINLIKTPIGTIALLGLAVWLLEGSFKKDKKRDNDELETLRREIEELKKGQEQ